VIGEIVRFRSFSGKPGAPSKRLRVKAVELAQTHTITTPRSMETEPPHYILLCSDLETGDLLEITAAELRMETLAEARDATPYVKPPPTAIPGDPDRR
jgi:hypothetical protein